MSQSFHQVIALLLREIGRSSPARVHRHLPDWSRERVRRGLAKAAELQLLAVHQEGIEVLYEWIPPADEEARQHTIVSTALAARSPLEMVWASTFQPLARP